MSNTEAGLPKEIKDQIAGEAAKLCGTTPLEDSEIYMAYEMGATAWAEKMLGFANWVNDNHVHEGDNLWFHDGDISFSHPLTTAELLVYYINQIKK